MSTRSQSTSRGPVLLISFFTPSTLARILERLSAHRRPAGTRVFIGSYGINGQTAAAIASGPRLRYAPIFSLDPKPTARVRAKRPLPQATAKTLDQTYEGPVPADPEDPRISTSDQRGWGLELGRRFRDQLRQARTAGVTPSSWQFDEILGECRYQREPNRYRRFVGGVVRGLAEGRPELGDRPEAGFVWVAWSALQVLPSMRITPELEAFWEDLQAGAGFLVGEEYPAFRSNPTKVALVCARPQQALADSGGAIRTSLARRYIVGMTPGWKTGGGLGGNVYNWPLERVSQWRARFLAARTSAQRPAGYAQFYLAEENALPDRIDDAIAALHIAAEYFAGRTSPAL